MFFFCFGFCLAFLFLYSEYLVVGWVFRFLSCGLCCCVLFLCLALVWYGLMWFDLFEFVGVVVCLCSYIPRSCLLCLSLLRTGTYWCCCCSCSRACFWLLATVCLCVRLFVFVVGGVVVGVGV